MPATLPWNTYEGIENTCNYSHGQQSPYLLLYQATMPKMSIHALKTCEEGMGPFQNQQSQTSWFTSKKDRKGLYPPLEKHTGKGEASPFPATLCQRSKNNDKIAGASLHPLSSFTFISTSFSYGQVGCRSSENKPTGMFNPSLSFLDTNWEGLNCSCCIQHKWGGTHPCMFSTLTLPPPSKMSSV